MIRIGTSGYSFPHWVGAFYPRDLRKGDWLEFYAQRFPIVEINSTYYGIPHPKVFREMEKKTPAEFEFLVKLHASQTHTRESVPETLAALVEAVSPLAEHGKFSGFLGQFPWSFKESAESWEHVAALRRMLPREIALYAEFRHASWISEATFARLRELGIGYCSVDEPRLPGLVPPVARATGAPGYVRFHGRNAANWWTGDSSLRYDYTYNEEELRGWIEKVRALERDTGKVYLLFNNCHEAKAVQGARLMAGLLAAAP